MAAIGKIRSWGPALITVIGLALFAFIAEELFRSCDSLKNQERQRVGEVLGKKIDVQEFQKLVDEYTDVLKMTQGRENLTDAELNQVKDMVWNQYVQNAIIEKEAKALGLTVTDEEMQAMFQQGTNPALQQTPFVNQQTGRFDVNQLKQFLAQYNNAKKQNPQMAEQYRSLYNYWTFLEKNIRQQLLAQKYQALLGGCMLSNPISARMAFDGENQESDIMLAAFPYSEINDNKVQVTDEEIKVKYEELKPRFKQTDETRDIKYVDFAVTASPADRNALNKTVAAYREELANAADPAEVIRKSASQVAYLGIPQTKTAFPVDIANRLDSIAVGTTTAVIENKQDNTLNIIKLIAKQQLPDSIEFRAIQVVDADASKVKTKADSIYNALQGGADFETIAKKYGQTGEKTWLTSPQYQTSNSMDKDSRTYLNTLNTAALNSVVNLPMTNGHIILQVTDRRSMVDKYTVAVIKKSIDFTKDTYSAAYNKFSQFVSENQTLEAIEKNAAKYGYQVSERPHMRNSEHYVAGIHSTREALKWIFDAKPGEVSPLYECGDNDHLLVVALTGVNKKGYLPVDNKELKDYLKSEVMKDKKAAQILEKVKSVKTLADAKAQGAKVDTVKQVTFNAPVFVKVTGASEPALSGAVAATQKGKFCATPIKGNAGVYFFQVEEKKTLDNKFDAKAAEERQKQRAMQSAGNFMQELYQNAEVKDNRYLFF
jgi:peptidyl-prolyl cis-trans isomerase D